MELDGKTRLIDGRFDTIALSTGQRKRLALVVAALEDRPVWCSTNSLPTRMSTSGASSTTRFCPCSRTAARP